MSKCPECDDGEYECAHCGGSGMIECENCGGTGEVEDEEEDE